MFHFLHPTQEPADALCKAFAKFCEETGFPAKLFSESCPSVFKDDDSFFVQRRKDLLDLKQRLDTDEEGRKWSLPRGDYEYLWELILVSILLYKT